MPALTGRAAGSGRDLAGTSAGQVSQALRGVRHRLLALGVGQAGLRRSIDAFLTG